MTIDATMLNIILSVVGAIFAILLSVNAFFITRLVSKIDEAHTAAGSAEVASKESAEKLKGLERVIREITELKSDMQLFKYVMVNNLGVKLPEKKEG